MKRDDVMVDIILLVLRAVGWALIITGALAWEVVSRLIPLCATWIRGPGWWKGPQTGEWENWGDK